MPWVETRLQSLYAFELRKERSCPTKLFFLSRGPIKGFMVRELPLMLRCQAGQLKSIVDNRLRIGERWSPP